MTTHERLRAIFRQALQLPPGTDVDTVAYRQTPQWDSVAHMQLVSQLESAFGVMLETSEILELSNFEKAVATVIKHGAPTT